MADNDIGIIATELRADLNQFEAQMKRAQKIMNDSTDAMVKKASSGSNEIERLLGKVNPNAALGNVLGGLRKGAIEEGTKQIGVLGNALEALGPAGLAAGAALAGVGFAMEQGIKAAEWAEDIERTSKILGVTTDTLQKFDAIAGAAGIPVDKMRDSLKGLNQVIGLVEANGAKARTLKLFSNLGLDPNTLKSLGDVSNILPKIIDQVSQLNSPQRAAAAKLLRIDPEVLQSLIDYKGDIGDLMGKMKEYGLVLDGSVIQKGAEANKKMNEAKELMQMELRRAFIDLAPTIATIEEKLIPVIDAFARFVIRCGDAVTGINSLLTPIGNLAKALGSIKLPDLGGIGGTLGNIKIGGRSLSEWGSTKIGNSGFSLGELGSLASAPLNPIGALQAGFHHFADVGAVQRQNEDAQWQKQHLHDGPPVANTSLNLGGTKHAKHAPQDETERFNNLANSISDGQDKAYLEAQLALTTNIEDRAKIQKALADAEYKTLTDKAHAANAAIDAAGSKDKNAAQQKAQIGAAEALEAETEKIKEQIAKRALAIAVLQRDNEIQQSKTEIELQGLQRSEALASAQAGLAKTVKERNLYEQEALRLRQQAEDEEARQAVANAQEKLDEAKKAGKSGQDLIVAQNNLTAALNAQAGLVPQHGVENAQLAKNQEGPGAQYLDSLNSKDINDQLQEVQVKGLQGISDGLTGVIMGTEKASKAFHDMAASIISDLLKIGIERTITQPLANMLFPQNGTSPFSTIFSSIGSAFGIPAHASGIDSMPPGLNIVGDGGPELLYNPTGGGQVGSNSLLRNMFNVPKGGGNSVNNFHMTTNVQASDAVLTSWVQQQVTASHVQAVNTAVKLSQERSARANRTALGH